MNFVFILILVSVQYYGLSSNKPKIVCYWLDHYMEAGGDDRHTPENIDPTLCTHLHVLDDMNTVLRTGSGKLAPDVYQRLSNLKRKNPELKIIASFGDNPGVAFSQMVSEPGSRREFTTKTIEYLHKYKWDGLDLDWEFPVCWGGDCSKGPKADKPNFANLLKELRVAFDKENPKLSLSVAMPSAYPGGPADQGYDMSVMASALDYMSVMTYDLAGPEDGKTGHHSRYQSCIRGTQYYVTKGMPKDKVLMGVPFYGRTFKLRDRDQHGMGAPISGAGQTPHGEGNVAFYREMCDLVKNKGWAKEDTNNGYDPIAYHDLLWVGYDDPYAAYDKSKWVVDNGYGGIIVWQIIQDDFGAKCCHVSYPMLRAINHGLYGSGDGPDKYGCEHK
ncbi:unnamed protein product [Oppiella nova]|uniref:GH18 domain-containing protein n=1 Tax=Oppiella nova TaxID=334625 RepID=A0A7R9LV58_9ACAR|nr:unnamed protein product [Oppiella nova]CAG2166621.1 unnamed protein product [Oppiella nova]